MRVRGLRLSGHGGGEGLIGVDLRSRGMYLDVRRCIH